MTQFFGETRRSEEITVGVEAATYGGGVELGRSASDHHRGNNFHVNKFWGNLEKEQSTIKHHALGQKSWVGSC